ncbi:MAG: hypothetical protein D6732_26975 [Methanobacteriota archaeon]|nr:MAG: hypothetical protein D6732_26975 [Euryarchaeota archaeon]
MFSEEVKMGKMKNVSQYYILLSFLFVFLLLLMFVAPGCVPLFKKTDSSGAVVFFNSFETPRDTLSWYWAGKYRLTSDTPPGGGGTAVEIAGGNILPSATFISRPLKHGGFFTLDCWGKTMDVGGYVELAVISDHEIVESISVSIVQPQWKFLQTPQTIFCPPHSSLMITIHAGALSNGKIVVDNIRVKKVIPGRQSTARRQSEGNPSFVKKP